MEIIAFIIAVLAFVVFAVHSHRSYVAKGFSWLSLGLALLTAAWVCSLVLQFGTSVVIH